MKTIVRVWIKRVSIFSILPKVQLVITFLLIFNKYRSIGEEQKLI